MRSRAGDYTTLDSTQDRLGDCRDRPCQEHSWSVNSESFDRYPKMDIAVGIGIAPRRFVSLMSMAVDDPEARMVTLIPLRSPWRVVHVEPGRLDERRGEGDGEEAARGPVHGIASLARSTRVVNAAGRGLRIAETVSDASATNAGARIRVPAELRRNAHDVGQLLRDGRKAERAKALRIARQVGASILSRPPMSVETDYFRVVG